MVKASIAARARAELRIFNWWFTIRIHWTTELPAPPTVAHKQERGKLGSANRKVGLNHKGKGFFTLHTPHHCRSNISRSIRTGTIASGAATAAYLMGRISHCRHFLQTSSSAISPDSSSICATPVAG
jgi:hypothetical protein